MGRELLPGPRPRRLHRVLRADQYPAGHGEPPPPEDILKRLFHGSSQGAAADLGISEGRFARCVSLLEARGLEPIGMFELTRLDALFPLYTTRAEALGAR